MENIQPAMHAQEALKRQKVNKIIAKVIIYTFLILVAISTLFPFYWMINTSLKSQYDYINQNPQTFFPTEIHFENYWMALNNANFSDYLINTVIVGITSTLLGVIITIFAAFAFSRLNFKGKDWLFSILLATMMIPGELFQITNLITVMKLQWTNSFVALIIPFLVSVFYVYLLRNNFRQIPNELYYAAKVDGTKDMKYLWKVMVPLSMPTITSITILKLMGSWNSYIWPRLVNVSGTRPMRLIANWLMVSFTDPNSNMTHYPMRMAGVFIVSLPLFIVFIFFRKYIMRGVSKSGTKG